jgi:hypothetical protein
MKVPRVQDYAQALRIHDNTKPLRGRADEIKPLGSRRDADTYHIRKHGDAVELVLYKTPVITFMPDGEVALFVDSYNTVATHQFIHQVLGISAGGVRRTTVLTINNSKYTLAAKDKLRLRKEDGAWQVLNPTQQWTWRLDRKAVTNVRAQYGEFYKYLKGFVNLRTESITENAVWNPRTYDGILVQQSEFKNVFGLIQLREYCYMDKRGKQHINWVSVKPDQYKASSNAFFKLIDPDQPEEDKHTNFYKAALALLMKQDDDRMDLRTDNIKVLAKSIVPLLDKVLFMRHAEEVLVREALPMGKVSTGTYDKWMLEW